MLGNWSGDSAGTDSFVEYTAVTTTSPGYDSGTDTLDYREHHNTDSINAITQRVIDGGTGARGAASETQTLIHDEAGNLVAITDGATPQPVVYDTYSYDAWSRVTAVTTNTGQNAVVYEYDALGRRISRREIVNATTADSLYYYDGNRIIEEHRGDIDTPGSMSLHAQYVYGLDYIDEHVAYFGPPDAGGEQTLYFALTDANYNVVALVDGSGNTFEQYSYEPYGDLFAAEQGHDGDSMLYAVGDPNNPENPTDPNDPNATVPLVYHFGHQGLLRDPLVGLIHNRARDYNLTLARFNQHDPNSTALVVAGALARNAQPMFMSLGLSAGSQYTDGANLFQYVNSNPLSNRDPMGLILGLNELTTNVYVRGQFAAARIGALGGGLGGQIARLGGLVIVAFLTYDLATNTATQDLVFSQPNGPMMASELIAGSILRAGGGIFGLIRRVGRGIGEAAPVATFLSLFQRAARNAKLVDMTASQERMVRRALRGLKKAGYDISFIGEVQYAPEIPAPKNAMTMGGEGIALHDRAFKSQAMLRHALEEELRHLMQKAEGLADVFGPGTAELLERLADEARKFPHP